MKYTLHFDQKKGLELGINNIAQGLIFDFLTTVGSWAEPLQIDGVTFFWVARQKVVDEMPILKIKPDTVYRHFVALSDLGLIEYTKEGAKDLVRITLRGQSYLIDNPIGSVIPKPKIAKEVATHASFDLFWSVYPNRQKKKQAQEAWAQLKPNEDLCQVILSHIAKRLEVGMWSIDSEGLQYIVHPNKFLKDKRWTDTIVPKVKRLGINKYPEGSIRGSGIVKSMTDRSWAFGYEDEPVIQEKLVNDMSN